MKVVYVHRGDARFLGYAVAQARSFGHECIVLGDSVCLRQLEAAELDAMLVPIEAYSQRAELFRQSYKHLSVNALEYELFCIQRWFLLASLSEAISPPFLYSDSDILVYKGLTGNVLLEAQSEAPMANTSWINYIATKAAIDAFVSHLEVFYASESNLSIMAAKYSDKGRAHISDMTLLRDFNLRAPDVCADTTKTAPFFGFDGNMRLSEGFEMTGAFKRIEFVDGSPYCFPGRGGMTRYYTLHFQGRAKPLMQVMNSIAPSLKLRLTDLEDELALLSDHQPVIDLYRHLAAMAR